MLLSSWLGCVFGDLPDFVCQRSDISVKRHKVILVSDMYIWVKHLWHVIIIPRAKLTCGRKFGNIGIFQMAEERNLGRPPTSAGSTKPTTTPVPPPIRARPTSAVPRPASGGSVQRINSARLTMRPQSARPCSRTGSATPSPPPEEPRDFLPNQEEQETDQQQQQQELPEEATEQVRAPSSEPVEVPVDTPREESANVEED